MSRAAIVRQTDLTRIFKAARAAGVTDLRVELAPDGKMVLLTGSGAQLESNNSFDALVGSKQ